MSRFNFFILVLGSFLLNSCFTARKEREIKDEISEVRGRIGELEKSLTEKGQSNESQSRRSFAGIQSELERLNVEVSRLRGEVDALKIGVSTGEMPGSTAETPSVAAKITELSTRIDELSLALAASKSAQPKQESPGASAGSGSSQDVSLREIREAYNAKKFTKVATNGDALLGRLKSKGAKEELSFYIAESLFRLNRTREAALRYNDFAESFPGSARQAHAKLRLGDCFKQLGDVKASRSFYQELVSKYPKSAEATAARSHLKELGDNGAENKTNSSPTKSTASKKARESRKQL